MFCGYWKVDLIRLVCYSVVFAGVTGEQGKHFIYRLVYTVKFDLYCHKYYLDIVFSRGSIA